MDRSSPPLPMLSWHTYLSLACLACPAYPAWLRLMHVHHPPTRGQARSRPMTQPPPRTSCLPSPGPNDQQTDAARTGRGKPATNTLLLAEFQSLYGARVSLVATGGGLGSSGAQVEGIYNFSHIFPSGLLYYSFSSPPFHPSLHTCTLVSHHGRLSNPRSSRLCWRCRRYGVDLPPCQPFYACRSCHKEGGPES